MNKRKKADTQNSSATAHFSLSFSLVGSRLLANTRVMQLRNQQTQRIIIRNKCYISGMYIHVCIYIIIIIIMSTAEGKQRSACNVG
jgi:hypothetical protein